MRHFRLRRITLDRQVTADSVDVSAPVHIPRGWEIVHVQWDQETVDVTFLTPDPVTL